MIKESNGFFGSAKVVVIHDPELIQRTRLPGDIAEPHLDRERLPVGILRRFRLAHLLIHRAGLMPAQGDHARFVQSMASERWRASSSSGKAGSEPPAVFSTRAKRKQAIARS